MDASKSDLKAILELAVAGDSVSCLAMADLMEENEKEGLANHWRWLSNVPKKVWTQRVWDLLYDGKHTVYHHLEWTVDVFRADSLGKVPLMHLHPTRKNTLWYTSVSMEWSAIIGWSLFHRNDTRCHYRNMHIAPRGVKAVLLYLCRLKLANTK